MTSVILNHFLLAKALPAFQVKEFSYPGGIEVLTKNIDAKELVIGNIIGTYDETAREMGTINEGKATKLKLSVWFITLAILALITFMIFMVLHKCNSIVQSKPAPVSQTSQEIQSMQEVPAQKTSIEVKSASPDNPLDSAAKPMKIRIADSKDS